MSIKHHLRTAGVGFATKHPWLSTVIALTGIGAIVSIATGKHATPPPAAQTPPPPKA